MKEITIAELDENIVTAISKEWMLVTAGSAESWNTMTASWGGIGFLWNRPVAFVFPSGHSQLLWFALRTRL